MSTNLANFGSLITKKGTNEYAYQAFGRPQDPTFLPLSTAYVPIDLSNKANTHATLAHSASHVAKLRGGPAPLAALSHKIAAIKLVNEALNDPTTATSDGTLAAVLRLSTFEVRSHFLLSKALVPLLLSTPYYIVS